MKVPLYSYSSNPGILIQPVSGQTGIRIPRCLGIPIKPIRRNSSYQRRIILLHPMATQILSSSSATEPTPPATPPWPTTRKRPMLSPLPTPALKIQLRPWPLSDSSLQRAHHLLNVSGIEKYSKKGNRHAALLLANPTFESILGKKKWNRRYLVTSSAISFLILAISQK